MSVLAMLICLCCEIQIVQAKNDDEMVRNEGRLEQACASTEYALEAAGGRIDQRAKSEFNGVLSIVRGSRAQFQLPERPKDSYKRIVRLPSSQSACHSLVLVSCVYATVLHPGHPGHPGCVQQ